MKKANVALVISVAALLALIPATSRADTAYRYDTQIDQAGVQAGGFYNGVGLYFVTPHTLNNAPCLYGVVFWGNDTTLDSRAVLAIAEAAHLSGNTVTISFVYSSADTRCYLNLLILK